MGHVDHGKTSLLDAIRSTTVAAGERGGITQHIGASEVEKEGRRVVFLDTPGHEAFTAMRARGARVTDIAVLVVAADDGVMPQTLEAIDHARAAKVPIVVALNKIDKPDANPDRVKTELSEHGVIIEEYGGDVPLVAVSAKTGQGIDDLLETILLTSDALVEPKANPKRPAVGTVVEAELDKGRGAVATILVQTGTLRIGDTVVVGETYGRVRAMENSLGKRVTKAGPATAVVLLGLGEVPAAGDILRAVPDEKTARAMVEDRRASQARPEGGRATLEDLYRQIQAGQTKELRIILKADVQGSLGAIMHALDQIQTEGVRINVLHEGTGDITDNDILLASASDAIVVGFNTKLDPAAAAHGGGGGRRGAQLRHHLPPHRGDGRCAPGHARAGGASRSWRATPRCARSSVSARPRPSPAATSPTGGSCAAAPASSGAAAGASRRRSHRVAASLPGRCPRGGLRLRVRHRPGQLQRLRGRRHHRVLHAADGQSASRRRSP